MKTIKSLNKCPEVVKNPTRYKGGITPCEPVVTNPTRYKGGLNIAACDVPKKGK